MRSSSTPERRPGRFHVPGHKGGEGADPAAIEALGRAALDRDVPAGIEGIDVGPDSPFQRAQRLAAGAWGARRSWFPINGASQGNHATCLALRHGGRGVIVQRNAHSSTIDGIILAGLEPTFVAPELDPELGVAHCLTRRRSPRRSIAPGRGRGVVATSTYLGAVADVGGLSEVCHDRGLPLVVDEAWGSHLRFSPLLPADALSAAPTWCSPRLQLLGSLTQSAILHQGASGRSTRTWWIAASP